MDAKDFNISFDDNIKEMKLELSSDMTRYMKLIKDKIDINIPVQAIIYSGIKLKFEAIVSPIFIKEFYELLCKFKK